LIIIDEAHNISTIENHTKMDDLSTRKKSQPRKSTFRLFRELFSKDLDATIILATATPAPDRTSRLLSVAELLCPEWVGKNTPANRASIDDASGPEAVKVLQTLLPKNIGMKIIYSDRLDNMPNPVYQGEILEEIRPRMKLFITKFIYVTRALFTF